MEYAKNGGIAYTPENINKQLLLGKSREQLAKLFGHKSYKSLDMYMRRKNYAWNGKKQVYEIKAKRPRKENVNDDQAGSKRVRQILKAFKEGKDAKRIAKEFGFKNHLVLAEYMKDKGYLWDHQESCYKFKGSGINEQEAGSVYSNNVGLELEERSQQFLDEREHLGGNKNLPRYSLAGLRVAKTIQFSNNLNQLLLNFTADKNINQREFFEIAAIEMMKKYGYEAEIKGLLG